jgi:lipopolysaccharide transport system ATP-binding protein
MTGGDRDMAAVDGPVALRCDDVAKAFPVLDKASGWRLALGLAGGGDRVQALDGVSFAVPKGEFVGILGRNGAGKSTLLRVLGGIYRPDCGRVCVVGDLSGLYEIGTSGNSELTGREYARRFLSLSGVPAAALPPLIDEIREFAELDDRFDDSIVTYSTGMAARLYFAVATARQHEVYLIDEVLSVGDSHFQAKCWNRIRARVAHGASGVLVTHDWSAVIKLCRTAHIMDAGRIVFSGPAALAVRRYLYGPEEKLPGNTRIARFEADLPPSLAWRSGEDSRLRVPVQVFERRPVCLRLSIERMSLAVGWEIVLMSRAAAPIGAAPGRYLAEIAIPALPLAPGTYVLNLFLGLEPGPDNPERVVVDTRSWLAGNGIELCVTGAPQAALLRLPMDWHVQPA